MPPSDLKQVAIRTNDLPLPQLAAGDPRIAKLLADNSRLNEEIVRSSLKLIQLNRRIQSMDEKSATVPSPSGTRKSEEEVRRIADLERQVDLLRRTVSKLAEENRWHVAARARVSSQTTMTQASADPRKIR